MKKGENKQKMKVTMEKTLLPFDCHLQRRHTCQELRQIQRLRQPRRLSIVHCGVGPGIHICQKFYGKPWDDIQGHPSLCVAPSSSQREWSPTHNVMVPLHFQL